ncbi:hypothetical protein [Vibrio owensii]|uniref:hypothetical protein n=1 Tax=Vibrio owensii TaxID=696485 RepID=UPI003CC5CA03
MDQLQKRKYLHIFNLIEKKAGGAKLDEQGFGDFIEKIEEKRLGFIAKILGRKDGFKQNPCDYIAQPLSVLTYGSMYETSIHDALDLTFSINEMAYEKADGSIWINTSARPEDIFNRLVAMGYSSIVSHTFDGTFKISKDLRQTSKFLRNVHYNRAEGDYIWHQRYMQVLENILLVSRKKIDAADTLKEITDIMSLDNFIVDLCSSGLDESELDTDFISFYTGHNLDDLKGGCQPRIKDYEMWGYCVMQAFPVLVYYLDLFDENGLKSYEIFEDKAHVIMTSHNEVEHHVMIDVLRNYLALSMGAGLEGLTHKAESTHKSRVINIDQRTEALRPGLAVVAAQVRSLGHFSNFFLLESGSLKADGSNDELCSLKANTKLKVLRGLKDTYTIQSPFYLAFQQKDYIELDR